VSAPAPDAIESELVSDVVSDAVASDDFESSLPQAAMPKVSAREAAAIAPVRRREVVMVEPSDEVRWVLLCQR